MLISALLAVAALAVVPVHSTLPSLASLPVGEGWKTVLRHECGGGFEFTPKMPWGINIDLPFIERFFIAIRKKARDRARCRCPGLSDADFNLMFDPVTALLNVANADADTQTPTTSCQGVFPASMLDIAPIIDVKSLPTTCNLATWQASGKCSMQYPVKDLGVNIGISVWQCSGSFVPGFALNCLGDNCAKLFQPCNAAADCTGGLTCTTTDASKLAWDIMSGMELYNDTLAYTEKPGCLNSGSQDPTVDAVPFFMTYLRSIFPNSGTNYMVGACGIQQITDGALRNAFGGDQMFTTSTAITNAGCVSDKKQTLSVPSLAAWDGTIASGVVATTPGQTLLEPTTRGLLDVTSGKAGRVAQLTCDGQALLLDGQFRMKVNPWGTTRLANYFTSLVKASQDCHVKTPWTTFQFNLRYAVWNMLGWLFIGDSAAATVSEDLGENPPQKTWMASIAKGLDGWRLKMPTSCSYATWKSKGSCALEFTGLATLLQLDVTFRASATQCSASPWPALNIDCVGSDCKYIMQPHMCSSDSDCGGLAVCTDILSALQINNPSQVLKNIYADPIGTLLPSNIGNPCAWKDFTGTDTTDCGGAAKGVSELAYILQFAFNVDSSSSSLTRRALSTDSSLSSVFKEMRRATSATGAKVCLPASLPDFKNRTTPWVDSELTLASASKIVILNSLNSLTYNDPDPRPYVPIDVSTADFSVTGTVAVAANRQLGAACYANQQCASGQCTNSLCVEAGKSSISASCSTSDDCATGNCFQGTCQVTGKKLSLGKTCAAAADCESGICTATVCKLPAAAAGQARPSLVAAASNTIVGCPPNITTKISLPGNLGLAMNAGDSTTVNVTVRPTPPDNVAVPDQGISTYYNFDISTGSSFQANLTFAYVDDLLTSNGYAAEDLTWARFDTSSKSWTVQRGIVDQKARTVTYQTNKFSTWTVIAAKSAAMIHSPLPLAVLVALVCAITGFNV
ncbi:hypothetical protein HDU89_000009 [Geranomyces variabilis]|nr:hypothetical protein HDU89_000009 [Geranomyces variabilis]